MNKSLLTLLLFSIPAYVAVAEPIPPEGFRAIFNGKDLSGWHGLNPHSAAKLKGEKREANLARQRADFAKHWTVENGELVNDGHGPYTNTDEEFGDVEFLIEYKTVAKADSGIYLRGNPQVQIWDWNQAFNPERQDRKPHLGSGALHNNKGGGSGREPHVLADAPFGEWNRFRIRQIGDKTWIWLNDKLVVDGYTMENYWDREKPLPAKGRILLQTHGGEIRWRNIFVREIGPDEAGKILAEAEASAKSLAGSLSLHAGFDDGLDADFSRGDRTAYIKQKQGVFVRADSNDDAKIDPAAGKFGGAVHFTRKGKFRPSYKHPGILNYNTDSWNSTVSVWMRLNPDDDLEPGYCDPPVQIIGDTTKKGFVFLEFSKDHTPRHFRYAIRPNTEIWNPDNVGWEDIPAAKRPMIEIKRPLFSRDKWTHVAFTLENINSKDAGGRLYINGEARGAIQNWDLTFGWDPEAVLLVLGAAYVGHLDDLAVFNRVLSEDEVKEVFGLGEGVKSLYSD